MAVLVDTNVLLRLTASQDRLHQSARSATETLRDRGETLVTSSQNLIETWNVATRPVDKNGLGHTPETADALVAKLERGFRRLASHPDTYDRWRGLVVQFSVSGVQVHDARLVAIMLNHGLTNILSFNARDFQRYATLGIRAVDPKDF